MADVNLFIGGQKYTVACGDGQEQSLKELAAMLDEKVSYIKSNMPASESLGLVMGALLLANEMREKNEELAAAHNETAVSPEVLTQTVQLIEKVSNKISSVAETMENA